MALAVGSTNTYTGDKTSAASKTLALPAFASTDEIFIILFAWQKSTSAQTISVSSAPTGCTATVLAQRGSTGLSGIAVILVQQTPGANDSLNAGGNLVLAASTGNIVAWGANRLEITGAGPETGIAWVGADNTTGTTTTPTATSGSAAIGDLVIGALSLKGPTGDTFTQDNDVTGGAWNTVAVSGTSGGSATTNQTMRGGYKIPTAAGAQTYNPVLGTARNYAELIGGLKATTAKSGSDSNNKTEAESLHASITVSESIGSADVDLGYASSASAPAQGNAAWSNPDRASGTPDAVNFAASSMPAAEITDQLLLEYTGEVAGTITSVLVTVRAAASDATSVEIEVIIRDGLAAEVNLGLNTVNDTLTDIEYSTVISGTLSSLDPSTGLTVVLMGNNTSALLRTVTVDAASFSYVVGSASGAVESADVVQSGGSTPKNSSDANGTTTEATTLVAVYTASDINGSTTETPTLTAVLSSSDSGSDTETPVLAAAYSANDANGTTTESPTLTAAIPGTETNGSTTETPSLAASLTISEINGSTTENTNLSAALSATDNNSSGSESASLSAAVSTTDSGAGTETPTLVTAISISDSGSDVEVTTLDTAINSSDAGTSSLESPSLEASITENETNGYNALTTLLAQLSSSDTNGATTENGTVGDVIINVSDTDFNGASTETPSLLAQLLIGDTGTDSENPLLTTLFIASDGNVSTLESVIQQAILSASESGAGNETATLIALITTSDTSGAITEFAEASALILVSDEDFGTGTDLQELVARYTQGDLLTANESANVPYVVINTSDAANYSETTVVAAIVLAVESATGFDLEELRATFVDNDSVVLPFTETEVLRALVTALDSNTLTTEQANYIVALIEEIKSGRITLLDSGDTLVGSTTGRTSVGSGAISTSKVKRGRIRNWES